jgi:hypothetical protein
MSRNTLYADFDLITGGETGADAANAWRNFQDAIDGKNGSIPVADTIKCTGTDTRTVKIDLDQGSGDSTDGYLEFIGCNSSFVNNGERAVIDGDNNSIVLLNANGPDYVRFANFVFKNAGGSNGMAFAATGYSHSDYYEFINCVFDNCYRALSLSAQSMNNIHFHMCQFLNSRNSAVYTYFGNTVYFTQCLFDASAVSHLLSHSGGMLAVLIDCYFIDATGNAIEISGNQNLIYNCIIDGGADLLQSGGTCKVIGTRMTNGTVGIDSDSIITLINSYMPDTGEDRANTTKITGIVDEIVINGSNSNNLSGPDTDGGYADPANGDFNLDKPISEGGKASQYNQVVDLES